ncbi:MAG: cytochrome c biogenesis protein CcsA [Sedimentisphaerales bacterium]|jgi:ABC-type transport system involved in cytochrome c biogenesis permease subunit|nr:cytochrome c biogenesis protein CcsA [Sedimentisphaerales bacterium]
MHIKTSTQGLLIYSAMVLYLSAMAMAWLRRPGVSRRLFFLGFLAAGASILYRWVHTGHVPMQNLFEVFLWLGMLVYPISLASNTLIGIQGTQADLVLGLLTLFPAGFVFSDQPQALPPALQSPFFIPHVASYMISYVLMAKAGFWAIVQLYGSSTQWRTAAEKATYLLICAGLPFMTLGLLLGSMWGHYAWGDWWGWDPKELWSLACWLVYVLYLHIRPSALKAYPRLNAVMALIGLAFIVVTLLWVNLSRLFPGLHSYAT